jgi:N-methylhydantoinase A
VDFAALRRIVDGLCDEGGRLLAGEGIAPRDRTFRVKLDCRYLKQYQEVTLPLEGRLIEAGDRAAIAAAFHVEHQRLFGYDLASEAAPIEIVNVRVTAVGRAERLIAAQQDYVGDDARAALKGARRAYAPEMGRFETLPVYAWGKLGHGHRIAGPALVEADTTTALIGASFDAVVDAAGSLVAYARGRRDLVDAIGARDATLRPRTAGSATELA